MIFLIRHGQTDWNKNHIIQGQKSDISLNEIGREQALNRAETFKGHHFDAIITSPLKRAKETAEILYENLDVDTFVEDKAFLERDYGPYDGTDSPGKGLKFYFEDLEGAEDKELLYERIKNALRKVADTYSGDVIIVSHGGISGSYIWHQQGDDDFWLVNTAVTAIDPNDLHLVGFNLEKEEIDQLLENK